MAKRRKPVWIRVPSDKPAPGSLQSEIDGCGKPQWSNAAGKFMPKERLKRIDPNSPEGQAIAKRYC